MINSKISSLLSSRRLAIGLISLLTVSVLFNTIGLVEVFNAWWFQVLIILFFLNTTFCTIKQFQRAAKLQSMVQAGKGVGKRFQKTYTSQLSGDDQRIVQVLTSKGYQVKKRSPELFAFKNILGLWGSPIFHLALLVILVGAWLGVLTGTWGKFIAVVGQPFTENEDRYVVLDKGLLAPKQLSRFTIRVDEIKCDYDSAGQVSQFATELTVPIKNGTQRRVIDKGLPLTINGVTLYQHLFGYTPVIGLQISQSPPAQYGIILDTFGEIGQELKYAGQLTLPAVAEKVALSFLPGPDPKLTIDLPNQPSFPRPLELSIGESMALPGATLIFSDYRMWASFVAVSNPWQMVIFAAFWLAVLGLGMMYGLNLKTVHIVFFDGNHLEITGTSWRFPQLFKTEICELVDSIKSNNNSMR